jgi:hypothetical protein
MRPGPGRFLHADTIVAVERDDERLVAIQAAAIG